MPALTITDPRWTTPPVGATSFTPKATPKGALGAISAFVGDTYFFANVVPVALEWIGAAGNALSGRAANAIGAAAEVCAISPALIAVLGVAEGLRDFGAALIAKDGKLLEPAAKIGQCSLRVIAKSAEMVLGLGKMGGFALSHVAVYALGTVRNGFGLILDIWDLGEAAHSLLKPERSLTEKTASWKKTANIAKVVDAVAAMIFHGLMVGAIFFTLPISNMVLLGAGTLCTITSVVSFFIGSHAKDVESTEAIPRRVEAAKVK
jgi:hypothetical protein